MSILNPDPITATEEYAKFRSSIPQRKVYNRKLLHPALYTIPTHCIQIIVDKTNNPWVVYDAGPRNVRSPLICLPPVCGTADVFFRQITSLSASGIRIISVSYTTLTQSGLCMLGERATI